MTVVMVSPLFIVELSFLRFVLYLSFGKFFTALQKFSKPGFFAAELHGLHGSRPDQKQNETVEQHRVCHLVARAAVH